MFDVTTQPTAARIPASGSDPRLALSADVADSRPAGEIVLHPESVAVFSRSLVHLLVSADHHANSNARDFVQASFIEPQLRIAGKVDASAGQVVSAAMLLLQVGRPGDARALLEPHIGRSDDYWLHHYFAVATHAMGFHQEAEAFLRARATRQGEKDYRPWHALGRLLIADKNWDAAEEVFSTCCSHRDAPSLAFNDYASVLIVKQEIKRAIRLLRSALRIEPNNTIALNNMGVCRRFQGGATRAVDSFTAALHADPSNAAALHNLAECHIEMSRYDLAIQLLEDIVTVLPTDVQAVERLAWAYFSVGNHARASSLLKRASEGAGANCASIHNNLGIVWAARGNATNAVESFERALSLDAQSLTARLNYASFILPRGRWSRVVELLEKQPGIIESIPANVTLAIALVNMDRAEDAVHILRAAIGKHGLDERLVGTLSHSLCAISRGEDAIPLLQQGINKHPNSAGLANNLAYVFISTGRLLEAREVLAPIMVRMPSLPVPMRVFLHATWGLLLIREGAFDEGIESYKTAQTLAAGHITERIRQKIMIEQARRVLRSDPSQARRVLRRAVELRSDTEFTREATSLLARLDAN